ncbi:MAG: hypothetical protein QOG85_953 [Gaiellaceae bacterium]|jgi:hypothetical protein|nr:hypothetical protein [Gaiellaceae bacterium]
MRPAILQWQIIVVLLAVVTAGVCLGSALHSERNVRVFYTYGINSPQPGGWTGYVPYGKPQIRCTTTGSSDRSCVRFNIVGGRQPSLQELRQICSVLRRELSRSIRNPFVHRSGLQMQLRVMCRDDPPN